MTVYVDDMLRVAKLTSRPAKWSHLLADNPEELAAFARQLGLSPRWLQHAGTHREHYDVTATVRQKAIRLGAVAITYPHGTAEVIERKKLAARRREAEPPVEEWYGPDPTIRDEGNPDCEVGFQGCNCKRRTYGRPALTEHVDRQGGAPS